MKINRDTVGKTVASLWLGLVRKTWTHFCLPAGLAKNRKNPSLLLCSLPRAGSTWLAKILSSGKSFYYNHEPFNPDYCSVCSSWDPYRGVEETDQRLHQMTASLAAGRMLSLTSMFYQNPFRFWSASHYLIKDVHILHSMEFLAQYEFRYLILLRHPCAFAESVARRNLKPNPQPIINMMLQDTKRSILVESLLEELKDLPADLNCFQQLGLYWSLAYTYSVQVLHNRNAIILRSEDLAEDPHAEISKLCEQLQIPFSAAIQRTIEKTTRASSDSYTRRDPQALQNAWRQRLTSQQAEDVFEGVHLLAGTVFSSFYSQNEEPSGMQGCPSD